MKNTLKITALFIILSSAIFGQNITVIGVGRLGLCLALGLEKAGHTVLGVDTSSQYVSKLNEKTLSSQEPSVAEYLQLSQNFRATTSLTEGLKFSDVYFIVAPTNSIPGLETYDHTILSNILKEIDNHQVSNKHIIICSTIFPGYIRNTANPLISNCQNTDISYNPEFIAQGNIIYGLLNPDIVLIGEGSTAAGDFLSDIYKNMCTNTPHIARMSPDSAEIAKLALNCFVTAKIAFANLIGDIADETPGADKYVILSTIGKDKRIGSQCLLPGFGFGGPCFPRDNRALGNYAELQGIEPLPLRATDLTNNNHTLYMANKLLESNLNEYTFEDVSYKPNCPVPIIEASQRLEVAVKIAQTGKKVTIKDRKEVIVQIIEKYGDLFTYEVM